MSMAVMTETCLGAHFFDRNDTAFQLLTAYVFELDGGVHDAEMLAQHVMKVYQDAGTL